MALIAIRVKPGASRSEIIGFKDGCWQVRLSAPPVEGKANKALVEILSRCLKVPRSSLEIVRGQRGRSKQVAVDGLAEADILKRLGG